MSDQAKPSRSLSEISHLFLSDVRARHTNGAAPPQRKPPQATASRGEPSHPPGPAVSIDLTPEEYAAAFGAEPVTREARARRPVAAVIATCSQTQHPTQHRAYGRHLASEGQRIGMIEIDHAQVRLSCFEPAQMTQADASSTEVIEPQRLRETLEELNADVDQWLVSFHHPRGHESRQLLALIDDWAVLCRCDHDSVVACYRTLKGLVVEPRPKLTLALIDAVDEAEAGRVFQKLSSVCQQFLHLPLKLGVMIQPQEVAEHVITCTWRGDGAATGAAESAGQILRELLLAEPAKPETPPIRKETLEMHESKFVTQSPVPGGSPEMMEAQRAASVQAPAEPALAAAANLTSDVIELPACADGTEAILTAVLQQDGAAAIECPVRPPMCGASRLAVDRQHRLVLIAATRQGLEDLRSIGQAYRWLIENRGLVAMAMPQFQIDAHQLPRLRLLVDQRDLSAELLQPMLQSGHVTVESYRKLRWGGRTGLLLEAA
jgi:hypothetical protein